jgi:hypothetical protein
MALYTKHEYAITPLQWLCIISTEIWNIHCGDTLTLEWHKQAFNATVRRYWTGPLKQL